MIKLSAHICKLRLIDVFMKYIASVFLIYIISSVSANCQHNTALEIMEDKYPRAGFFRQAEWGAANDNKYDLRGWLADHSRLAGIIGKCLPEESHATSYINKENLSKYDYYLYYKKNFPTKLLLCHFNGIARMPTFEMEPFFDGHWLYYSPAVLLDDISAADEYSTVHVSDLQRFSMTDGMNKNNGSDVCIVRVVDGKPDWNYAEQATVVGKTAETIRLKRGCYGSERKDFEANKTYLAVHVTDGPYGTQKDGTLLWYYNFSTYSPVDENGKHCWEILAEQLTSFFGNGGILEEFDGIEFDAMNPVLNPKYPYSSVPIDFQGIGRPSSNIIDGENIYSKGQIAFLKTMHENLGATKLLLADSIQEAFGYLNGVESEGFPKGKTYDMIQYYDTFNIMEYWMKNTKNPELSYVAGRIDYTDQEPFSHSMIRMHIAASCLLGCAYMTQVTSPTDPSNTATIWDELVGGALNDPGWLGRPLGDAVHISDRYPDVMTDMSKDISISSEGTNLVYSVKNIQYNGQLFVALTAKTAVAGTHRKVTVDIGKKVNTWSSVPVPLELGAYIGSEFTTSHYYFSPSKYDVSENPEYVDLTITINGMDPVIIDKLLVYNFICNENE